MNLRECYMKLDGNYDEVVQRLQNEYIVEKFMFKFLKDKSFNFLSRMKTIKMHIAMFTLSKEFVKIFHFLSYMKAVIK